MYINSDYFELGNFKDYETCERKTRVQLKRKICEVFGLKKEYIYFNQDFRSFYIETRETYYPEVICRISDHHKSHYSEGIFSIIDKYKKYSLTEKYGFLYKVLETLTEKEIALIKKENFGKD